MTTLNEYFRAEAKDFLTALERSLDRIPAPDAAELHRSVRGLRGTAQMAREQRVFDAVSAFESVTRSLAGGTLAWSEQVAAGARDTIADLRALLDPAEDDAELDARVSQAAARWGDTSATPLPTAEQHALDNETRELREFAAREAAGIADALDNGIRDLQSDPMNREPLRAILRRQRALLGSARLEEIPVIAEILRAIEDLTRVITKLDVGVKQEWLDIYRVARDALQSTIAPLVRDETPEPSKAVSRLRHMREELLERYGRDEGEAAPPHDAFGQQPVSHSAVGPTADALRAAAMPLADEDTAHSDVELDSESAVAESVLGGLELEGSGAVEESAPDFIELEEADAVEETEPDYLELEEANAADEDATGVLELDQESAADEDATGVLELDVESAVEESAPDVLELDETDAVAESAADVLDLDETSVVEAEAGTGADVMEIGEFGYTREDALQRALELHDVIARAAAGDPQARDAVEELFDLIRIARG